VADTDEWRTREFAATLEVVDVEQGDGRTVYGRAVPWNEPTYVSDNGVRFTEEFQRGAFAKACQGPANRVKFFLAHADLIGVARRLQERADGLYAELYMSKGERGDQLLEQVRDGSLDSLSVRFRGLQPRQISDHVIWREAMLREISLVPWGQYAGAVVEGVRADSEEPDLTPNLTQARRELARHGIHI
jgi:HK97 family phage prohead protease